MNPSWASESGAALRSRRTDEEEDEFGGLDFEEDDEFENENADDEDSDDDEDPDDEDYDDLDDDFDDDGEPRRSGGGRPPRRDWD